MNAIILCGGLSTRLGEITKDIPKVMLQIGDKTVLEWQLDKLSKMGVKEVVLAAGHLAHVLQQEVGEGLNGIKLIYAIEKEKLGTGGAIKNALQSVTNTDLPTMILNGDILTTLDLTHLKNILKPDSEGVILGANVPDVSAYGTIVFDKEGKLLSFKEKEGLKQAGHINGGIYLLTPHASKHFPDKNSFSVEYDVFPNMKNLYVFPSEHAWIDIGVPERLQWARDNWQTFI